MRQWITEIMPLVEQAGLRKPYRSLVCWSPNSCDRPFSRPYRRRPVPMAEMDPGLRRDGL